MKFSTIVLSALGFAALSLADTTESSVPTPTQTSSYPTDVVKCLDGCSASDATCQAKCLGSAAPDETAVNRTHDCVEKCDKGDGSAEATEKYSICAQSCISSIFLSSATLGPTGTGSGPSDVATATNEAGSSASSGSNPTATGSGSGSGSGSGASGTSSGASASSTDSGAGSIKAGSSFLALFGMAAGILAL